MALAENLTDDITNEMLKDFPVRLTRAIYANGLNKSSFAEYMRCSRNSVWEWTRGASTPNAFWTVKMAFLLGVSADWLLGLSDEGGPEDVQESDIPEDRGT